VVPQWFVVSEGFSGDGSEYCNPACSVMRDPIRDEFLEVQYEDSALARNNAIDTSRRLPY
jgi:hypothetical protein